MKEARESPPASAATDRLSQIEIRLARIERHLQLERPAEGHLDLHAGPSQESQGSHSPPGAEVTTEEDLELVVGQKWFAHVGILVLALGAGFALSLPYPGLPPALPSILGGVVVGGLFLLAHGWRNSFELISSYLRGAAMALFYFSALRLYYFGETPVLTVESWAGKVVLLLVMAFNLALALRRRSPYLLALALALGYLTVVLLHSPWIVFLVITAFSALIVHCWHRNDWPVLLLLGIPAAYLTHFLWAWGDSLRQGGFRPLEEPFLGPFFILLYGLVLGITPLLRRNQEPEDSLDTTAAVLNAGACYGLFLLHTLLGFDSFLVASHLVASAAFLGLAVALWAIRRSELACFLYAMTGYLALSVAILSAFAVPNVFVWLSLQSVVVVTTALWFRSPFIVVANFFIYVTVVLGYMTVAKEETGISLGFGLVALVSARILNWQKERLQLKTEKMRNAYLFSALVVVPYALYHMVPQAYVALSWVGVAGMYYLLNLLIFNQKYRWMGHFTLLLTVLYLLIVGISQLAPAHRVFSFLVLGTVLLAVSLIFTRQRAGARREPPTD